jgi:hypothetical protein
VSAAMKSEGDWLFYSRGGNLRTGEPEIRASCASSDSITTVHVRFEKRLILDSLCCLVPSASGLLAIPPHVRKPCSLLFLAICVGDCTCHSRLFG